MNNRPTLTRELLARDATSLHVRQPTPAMLALPERAVQFGTGALLRGFVDDFIDAANARGQFGGRIVAIGSTGSGRDRAFGAQGGLYTLVVAGRDRDVAVDTRRIVGAVSRALSATREWDDVLGVARDPNVRLVFSNTTEAGIALDDRDRVELPVPCSFPAKLTRFLYERSESVRFDRMSFMTVLPCELVEDNGDRLRALVYEQAARWSLGRAFTTWLDDAVLFCNTLVDRIVPGTPDQAQRATYCAELGYDDELLTVAEPYALFAIEGDAALASRIGILDPLGHIRVVADLRPYRERKLRILNGTHTAMAALGLLGTMTTVNDAMSAPTLAAVLRTLMRKEIVPVLDVPDVEKFAEAVLVRFMNPYVQHRLMDIAMQGTLKFRVRLLPLLRRHADAGIGELPMLMVLAFAALLYGAHPEQRAVRLARHGSLPVDDLGALVHAHWTQDVENDTVRFVDAVLRDETIWEHDLRVVPGLAGALVPHLECLRRDGVEVAMTRALREHALTPSASGA